MGVKLKFINRSNDLNNTQILIFHKNISTDFNSLTVAWKVIKNCGRDNYHPFYFPMSFEVSANDAYGNFTPTLKAENGQLFHMHLSSSGNVLSYKEPATSSEEIQVLNDMKLGAMDANIYKNNKLLAKKTAISPGQKAVFKFKPTIFIGAAAQIEEGQVIDSAILSNINTELNLFGIGSADIVMTGGGPGKNSKPFTFTLENIVKV